MCLANDSERCTHAWEPCLPRFNEVKYRWVSLDTWTFEKTFTVPADFLQQKNVDLLLNGVDTVADVVVNGKLVGTVQNFHRCGSPLQSRSRIIFFVEDRCTRHLPPQHSSSYGVVQEKSDRLQRVGPKTANGQRLHIFA